MNTQQKERDLRPSDVAPIGLDWLRFHRLKSFHPQEASLKGDSPSVTSPAPERIPSTTSQENC